MIKRSNLHFWENFDKILLGGLVRQLWEQYFGKIDAKDFLETLVRLLCEFGEVFLGTFVRYFWELWSGSAVNFDYEHWKRWWSTFAVVGYFWDLLWGVFERFGAGREVVIHPTSDKKNLPCSEKNLLVRLIIIMSLPDAQVSCYENFGDALLERLGELLLWRFGELLWRTLVR